MTDLDKAREEYKHALRSTYVSRDADECGRTYGLVDEDKADALIAALEAEVEALKCCGNCTHGSLEDFSFMCCRKNDASVPVDWWGDTHADDPCHFTPSRWERRQP